jgi:hypothetical protein
LLKAKQGLLVRLNACAPAFDLALLLQDAQGVEHIAVPQFVDWDAVELRQVERVQL